MIKRALGRYMHYRFSSDFYHLALFIGLVAVTAASADEIIFTAPIETLSPLIERPLFSGNRRAIEAPIQAPTNVETVAPLPLEGMLLGLAKGDDGIGFAILRLNGESQPLKIQIGELIKGWQLTSIDNHTALFSKDGQTKSLAFP